MLMELEPIEPMLFLGLDEAAGRFAQAIAHSLQTTPPSSIQQRREVEPYARDDHRRHAGAFNIQC